MSVSNNIFDFICDVLFTWMVSGGIYFGEDADWTKLGDEIPKRISLIEHQEILIGREVLLNSLEISNIEISPAELFSIAVIPPAIMRDFFVGRPHLARLQLEGCRNNGTKL